MSRPEVIDNIGTIAKSGTREFLSALTGDQRKDATLIGQFGVGFYSAFVVADRVTLTTRRAGLPAAEGVRWESDGRGEYTLETVDRPERGTEIVLHLRDGEDDLLNDYRLRTIIQKYSDHISLPIMMAPAAGQQDAAQPDGDIPVNRASALWARSKSEITEQDYSDFYRHITNDVPSRSPTCTARSRATTSTPCCCTSRPRPRSTCGCRSRSAASSCTSGGCSSWRTPGS